MKYIWDENKNHKNIERHDIAFHDAIKVFENKTLEREDDRFEYGEIRIYAIGIINGLEIVVIYTDTENNERRIISARRAEPYEKRAYWRKYNEF
jgi:uncharacterized DUF497 family protein